MPLAPSTTVILPECALKPQDIPRCCRATTAREAHCAIAGILTRISHQLTAADTDLTVFAALNAAGVLDVLSSTPARPDSRSPCKFSHLRALARNLVRNAG